MNDKNKKAIAALRKLGQRLRHGWDGFHSSDKVGSLNSVKAELKKKWLSHEAAERKREQRIKDSTLVNLSNESTGSGATGKRGKNRDSKGSRTSAGSRPRRKANRGASRKPNPNPKNTSS